MTVPVRARRVGRPADVAELVLSLLDGERSGFMTGANVVLAAAVVQELRGLAAARAGWPRRRAPLSIPPRVRRIGDDQAVLL